MNQSSLSPFSCVYTPEFPEMLAKLDVTIVISTFQAGKVIMISPKNDHELIQLPRTFRRPMGMALKDNKLAIACQQEVEVLKASASLAHSYPTKPEVYDQLYVPRASYYTGAVDIHDIHWGGKELFAINTSFSCLCKIDDNFSFTPIWKPPFITELRAEDRCHLNGLAMDEDTPKYVSALGSSNHAQSWRENITSGGIILDIESNEIVCQNLGMPHTPRLYDDGLYVLLSSEQKLIKVDVQNGKYEDVAHIPGFIRGMVRLGDFVFVATSKLRKNSSTFKHLKIADKADVAGINLVHLPTGTIMSQLKYNTSVDEIYDIQIIPGVMRPNILNPYKDLHLHALHLQDHTFWQQPSAPDYTL